MRRRADTQGPKVLDRLRPDQERNSPAVNKRPGARGAPALVESGRTKNNAPLNQGSGEDARVDRNHQQCGQARCLIDIIQQRDPPGAVLERKYRIGGSIAVHIVMGDFEKALEVVQAEAGQAVELELVSTIAIAPREIHDGVEAVFVGREGVRPVARGPGVRVPPFMRNGFLCGTKSGKALVARQTSILA